MKQLNAAWLKPNAFSVMSSVREKLSSNFGGLRMKLVALIPILVLLVLLPTTKSYAQGQSTSASNATSTAASPDAEIRSTLDRALDKIDALQKLSDAQDSALTDANRVITRSASEKKDLEEVISYKDRTIAAKDEALKAETDAKDTLAREKKIDEARIAKLEKELKSANRRGKFAFGIGVVVGAVGRGILAF
jgi:hypothetical protein